MSKKLVSLALVMMLLVTGVVYATNPSKQVPDMTQVAVTSEVVVKTEENALSTELAAEIKTVLDAGWKAVDYFSDDVRRDIEALLPAGVSAEDLSIDEFVPLSFADYEGGDVTVTFEFPTQYEPGQTIIAMVAVQGEFGVEWVALSAQVNEDGQVEIVFPAEIAAQIAAGDAALAILA